MWSLGLSAGRGGCFNHLRSGPKVRTCKRGHIGATRDAYGKCRQCEAERNRTPERRALQRKYHKRYRVEQPRRIAITQSLADRLFARTEPVPEAGCWLWTGAAYANGYGQVSIGAHRFRAHRASFAVKWGEAPDHLQVCHKCDTPSCINPDHLFVGTASENMQDMVRKGRGPKKRTKST